MILCNNFFIDCFLQKQKVSAQSIRTVVIALGVLLVSGCTSYGGSVKEALTQVETENYQEAETEFKKNLKPEGNDALLYYAELGLLHHLSGDYSKSNQLLSKAEDLAEDGYTLRVSEVLKSMFTSSSNTNYLGTPVEHLYYNYFKALNYLQLSEKARTRKEKESLLDQARVEARRIDLKLRVIEKQEGTYEEAKKRSETTFAQLLRIVDLLSGNTLEKDKLVFRQSAYANYLSGVIYERYGEWDDARISYQKAAQLYEAGYAEQLGLDQGITEQAWLDTARVMLKAGGYRNEVARITDTKLSVENRTELKRYMDNRQTLGEVIIIEHAGLAPRLGELNFYLTVDMNTHELVLRPILTGSIEQQRNQFAWFYMLYADKGLLDLVKQYREGGLYDVITRFAQEKRVGLGPLWETAADLGLIAAADKFGIRVTVPYYGPINKVMPKGSRVYVNGQSYAMKTADSPAMLALQHQLLKAGADLNAALVRESLQQITTFQATAGLSEEGTGALIGGLISLGSSITSSADTRSWLSMPYDIRIRRIALPAGQHSVKVNQLKTKQIQVRPGQLGLVEFRTFQQNTKALEQAY